MSFQKNSKQLIPMKQLVKSAHQMKNEEKNHMLNYGGKKQTIMWAQKMAGAHIAHALKKVT